MCVKFTEERWHGIYVDSKDYPECFGVTNKIWEDGKSQLKKTAFSEEKIIIRGGSFTLQQLEAMLNTIPLEITFMMMKILTGILMMDRKYLSVLKWQ